MKKLCFSAVAVLSVMIFASACNLKKYSCTCQENSGGVLSTNVYYLGEMNQNAAEKQCNDKQISITQHRMAASCKVTF